MIEPSNEMLAAFADEMREPIPVRERPERIRRGLAAVLAIERDQVPNGLDAAQWACIRCGYHNQGPVCTHCGRPLMVTAT